MKLLVLGGTKFLGRHIVGAALARGDEVTIFTRGLSNAGLFPEVERLRGDRDGGLDALRGRRWDAVVDTSGYAPRVVRASAELLAGAVDLYVFTSTMSVYADFSRPNDEGSPTAKLADESSEEVTGDNYGPLAVVERHFPIFAFAPPGVTLGGVRELLSRLKELRADTLAFTSDEEAARLATRAVRLPAELSETLAVIPYIIPAQLFAALLADAKGLDPDAPRSLAKVTRTL